MQVLSERPFKYKQICRARSIAVPVGCSVWAILELRGNTYVGDGEKIAIEFEDCNES